MSLFVRKNEPKHRKDASPRRVSALLSAFLTVLLTTAGFMGIEAAPSNAAATTTSVPDVAGSNTTVTYLGSPIREGATLGGGGTIGIGTSALLNPGVGQREIRTTYDAKTVYQAGTARAPEGWTLYYSINSGSTWSPTEPSPASAVTDIKATASSVAAGAIDGYSQEYSTETSASIPSSTFSASTGGDGWGVTFLDNYVFNLFHHETYTKVDCHLRSTGARCSGGYPAVIRNTSNVDFNASARSDLVADAANGKLYSLTTPTSGVDSGKVGMLCISVTSTPQYCGFTILSTTVNNADIRTNARLTEPIRVGNKIFGVSNPGLAELVCFDLDTNQKCANSPVAIDTSSSSTRLEKVGTQLFIKANNKMHCVQSTTMQACGSPWPKTLNASTNATSMIAVHTNTSKVEDGICSDYDCFNLAGEAQTWVNPYSVSGRPSDVWFKGLTALGRHYSSTGYTIQCFDYTRVVSGVAGAACTGWTSPSFAYLYEIEADPENPACFWTDDNGGNIKNFDAITGNLGCGANPVITLQPTQFAPRYACSTDQGIDQWGKLKISQLVGGGSASSIKLTVRNASGNPVTGFTDRLVALNTDLDMTTMNVVLSGSRPTFSFAFTEITGSITSATIALEYKGKGPELCSTAVLTSPLQTTAVVVNSRSVDSVGLTNLYESQRNFFVGAATDTNNLYLTVPSAPRSLSGTGLNSNATITFTPPSDNGGLALGDYFYSIDGGSTFNQVANLADNGDGTYSFSLTGLTPGQTYSIKVAATNSLGRGALASLSLTAQVVDFGNIPDTQQNAGPIYLPTQTIGGLPYTYSASPSNICTVNANVVTLLLPGDCGLTQNQSGDANHIATTASSTFKILVNPVIVVAPDAPTITSATPASTQVSLVWTAPSNNGNGSITDYEVQYKVGSSWVPLVDGVSTNTFAIVTGLTNGTTYSFKVAAVNSAGTGNFSGSVDAVPATVPGAVTSLAANKSGTSASLTWTAPSSNGGSAITDYKVEYKLSDSPTWSTFTDGVSATTGATVSGLTSNATYDFQVTTKNAAGFSTAVSTVTLVPTGQAAAIALAWAANTDGVVISNHIIEYRVLGAANWISVDTASTNRTATISSLVNGTSYEIRVARITGTGGSAVVSSYTSTVVGIPVTTPAAPTLFASAGAAQVELSWVSAASNGSAIYDYVVQYRLAGGTWATWAEGVSTNTTAVVLGLTNGSLYEFQVAAKNGVGTGSYSSTVSSTPRTVPGPVSGLALTVSGVTMSLAWVAPTDNGGSAITNYVIEYKLVGETTWSTLTRATSTSVSGSISGLNAQTRYSVRVAAVNAAGTGQFGPAGSELTGNAPSPSPNPRSEPAPVVPQVDTKFKQQIIEKKREKIELKFIQISDVRSVKIEGKEVPFTMAGGTVTFTDPDLSLGMKDVVVSGSWGQLTLSQVVEVLPAALPVASPSPTPSPSAVPVRKFATVRIAGFAPGLSKMTAQIMKDIRAFLKGKTSPVTLSCKGSTSGPTVLKQDAALARARATNVCTYIRKIATPGQMKTTSLNTIWVSPLARSVVLTVEHK